ncbi:hypothetical protein [Kushneria indalinina]|uniref:Uncharacterized protein n=1 Tax=Kushneria indalinina DSM 14324 TaxID=1122140 RepID=A0A3D9DVW3_9GAMM|nr:hypothetical protein [Kushneria indalinina]REC94886.1 hypothetical protein C8D72_1715 [Kushneria indalinina DSM 14324]
MAIQVYYSPSKNGFYHAGVNKAPGDAIKITDAEYEALRQGLSAGKNIAVDDNGRLLLCSAPSRQRRDDAIDWIDATADRIRASDRSVGQYLDAEYQLVAQALIEYRNSTEGEVPDAIRSYAVAEGLTIGAAAHQIAEAAARVQELLQDVRRIRLAGKAAIRGAGDEADMMEIARPYIDRLEALATPASADV